MPLSTVQPNVKAKTEEEEANSGGLSTPLSSPLGDAEAKGVSSDPTTENPKMNDAAISSSQSSYQKQDAEKSSEAVSEYHRNKFDELSGGPFELKRESEGLESAMAVKRVPSEAKHALGVADEHSRSGETILNTPAVPSPRKMVACVGKAASTSSTTVPSKSSTTQDNITLDTETLNHITVQRDTSDSNVSNKTDHASSDVVKEEERDDLLRNAVKSCPKSSDNAPSKASHSSRISHDSGPKRTVSDSKGSVLHSSSKSSPAQNIMVTTGSGESAGSLPHQKSLPAQNKIPASGLQQKSEKLNQTNFQQPSKMNHHSHGTSVHLPSSNTPATLSDEEV